MDQQMPPIQPKKALEFMPDVELMQSTLDDMDERTYHPEEIPEAVVVDEILYEEPEEEDSLQDEKSSIQICR